MPVAIDNTDPIPESGSVSEVDGYRAAGIAIRELLNDAELKRPKQGRINQKSAEYRAGVYRAFLTAHCLMVFGMYPNQPENQARIREILKPFVIPKDTLGRPLMIEAFTAAEWDAVWEREGKGEFRIQALHSLRTDSGKHNGAWRFEVFYPPGKVLLIRTRAMSGELNL